VIAIDPGLSGAIAAEEQDGSVSVIDLPTQYLFAKNKNEIDGQRLAENLAPYAKHTVILEDVHSYGARDGSVASFSFGRTKGIIEGVCYALGMTIVYVSPQRWKADLCLTNNGQKLSKEELKELSRIEAKMLYPELADKLKRKKDDGRAEALLLLKWGTTINGG
jgi:crossover junction endodeoxyribonuclease RuvC